MEITGILEGMRYGYRLKREGRHCWYEKDDRESVAEHCWRVSYLAILVSPHLTVKFDRDKLLRIIIMHDIAEAVTGDYHTSISAELKAEKAIREREAAHQIRQTIGDPAGEEIYDLWNEYETRQTIEARIASALDKIEAIISHLESPFEFWTPIDAPCFTIERYQPHFSVDPFIEKLFLKLLSDIEDKIAAKV